MRPGVDTGRAGSRPPFPFPHPCKSQVAAHHLGSVFGRPRGSWSWSPLSWGVLGWGHPKSGPLGSGIPHLARTSFLGDPSLPGSGFQNSKELPFFSPHERKGHPILRGLVLGCSPSPLGLSWGIQREALQKEGGVLCLGMVSGTQDSSPLLPQVKGLPHF